MKQFPFSKVRGFIALAIIAFTVVGLIFKLGSGTLSAFGFDQIAAICPLGALEVMIGAKEVMLHPLILLVVVIVVVILTGKAFCSWICPTPWVQKFFRPGKKTKNVESALEKDADSQTEALAEVQVTAEQAQEIEKSIAENLQAESSCKASDACGGNCLSALGGKRDGLKIDSRHGVLVGALLSSAVFGFPVFCLVCPIGLIFALIVALWNTFTAADPTWALLVIPVILLLELVFFRKWCAKICPMGALISLISNLNFTFKPKVSEDKCLREQGVDCHACVDACPEEVDPHSKRIPECSKCGKCVTACPAQAIKIKAL